MKYFLRPYRILGVAAAGVCCAVLCAPPGAMAQISAIKNLLGRVTPFISHSSSPGYLGVLVSDVDNEAMGRLKLKDNHGAEVTLIDHDAPAFQAGLHVSDVIMSVNGQAVENAEQFGRMLREFSPGHKVTLSVFREGATQNVVVQLVDRKVMEQDVWNKMNSGTAFPPPPSGMGILSGGGEGLPGFHMPWFGSSLNVGAIVEPLTAQMADYLGVPNGVLVKQVARKSEAANAGFKAHDVVLKVGAEPIKTTADWDRALRQNQGKPVQISILRDRKSQMLNLQVDSKRK